MFVFIPFVCTDSDTHGNFARHISYECAFISYDVKRGLCMCLHVTSFVRARRLSSRERGRENESSAKKGVLYRRAVSRSRQPPPTTHHRNSDTKKKRKKEGQGQNSKQQQQQKTENKMTLI